MTDTAQYLITPMGSNLIDIDVIAPAIEINVNYPGISTTGLELVTNLSAANGFHFMNIQALADGIEVESYCGSIGRRMEEVKVEAGVLSAKLMISVGPTGMYQNTLMLRTKENISFSSLIRQSILQKEYGEKVIVALRAIEGSGKHQHGGHDMPDHG